MFIFLSQVSAVVWDMTATPFSCETPAVFCGPQKSDLKIMTKFLFLGELSL